MKWLLEVYAKSYSFDWECGILLGALVMAEGSWWVVIGGVCIRLTIRLIAVAALSLANGGQAVPVQLVRKTRRGK